MKKSLLAFSFGFSILLFSCQKNNADKTTDPDDLSITQRGEDNAGSSDGVTLDCKSCIMTYPDNSNLPRSSAAFNENEILVASDPGSTTCGQVPEEIKVWYSDEHPLCLGVRQIVIKTKTGTSTTTFPITPSTTTSPSMAEGSNLKLGATDQDDNDLSGNDVAVGGGRPLWPALYVTYMDPGNLMDRSGDWQQGGTAYEPTKISGMWKSVVRTIDKTKNPATVTITVDADPSKSNGWNLPNGYAPPSGTPNEKYGAVVVWNVQELKKRGAFPRKGYYRLQFMVHDGDQNKGGGDVGQACTTIYVQ